MQTVPEKKPLKDRLRKHLRRARASIADGQRRLFDDEINRNTIHLVSNGDIRNVAAFIAFDGEPDLSAAMRELADQDISIALPCIVRSPAKASMEFRAWTPDCIMAKNHYGISEPQGTDLVPVSLLDLVLIPLVGWDMQGNRLGMGASFYDRLFQPFSEQPKPIRCGVAYNVQKVDQLPSDPWDIPLHQLISEQGLTRFQSQDT